MRKAAIVAILFFVVRCPAEAQAQMQRWGSVYGLLISLTPNLPPDFALFTFFNEESSVADEDRDRLRTLRPLKNDERLHGSKDNIWGDADSLYGTANASLSGDVSNIWGLVNGVTGDVSAIIGDVTAITGDVSNLRGNVSGLAGDVSSLSGPTSCVRGVIEGLSGSLECVVGDLSGISGEISPFLCGDVSGLRGNVTGLRGIASDITGDVGELWARLGNPADGDLDTLDKPPHAKLSAAEVMDELAQGADSDVIASAGVHPVALPFMDADDESVPP